MMRGTSPLVTVLLMCVIAHAQTGTTPANSPATPAASSSTALSHDRHGGMDVSADAYADRERAKEKFGKANPIPAGILPVEVFLRNETNQPIHIDLNTIQLEVQVGEDGRQDIDWLRPEEVADVVAHPGGPPSPQTRRLPLGIPLPSKDKKTDKLAEILRPLALDADVVAPMETIHGFLFFNMNHKISLAQNASLYIPGATFLATNKPLMFFEVPLNKPSEP
jgi:hypothetical protein